MISFNIPPYVGDEQKYIIDAIRARKLCGDGEYTKSVICGWKSIQV